MLDTLPDTLKPGAQQQIGIKKQQVLNQAQTQIQTQETDSNNADLAAGMDIYSSNALSPDASDEDAFDNANKFVGAINGRNDLTDADKSTQILQLQNDLAASTLSKTFNQALNESGTLGATELLNAAQFDEKRSADKRADVVIPPKISCLDK